MCRSVRRKAQVTYSRKLFRNIWVPSTWAACAAVAVGRGVYALERSHASPVNARAAAAIQASKGKSKAGWQDSARVLSVHAINHTRAEPGLFCLGKGKK